jgi:hypothetical protein
MNGLMIEQGSFFSEFEMRFDSDKNKFSAKLKAKRLRKDRKKSQRNIKTIIDEEI